MFIFARPRQKTELLARAMKKPTRFTTATPGITYGARPINSDLLDGVGTKDEPEPSTAARVMAVSPDLAFLAVEKAGCRVAGMEAAHQ